MIGPNKNYSCYGFCNFHSSAGLNSLTLTNSGNRSVEFLDGTKIDFDFGKVRKEFNFRNYLAIHYMVL